VSVDTYYSVLGLKEACSHAEIKAAYRELVRQVHPDTIPNASSYWKQTAEEKTKELNEAYSVLSDTRKRREYDGLLAESRQATTSQRPHSPQYQSPQPQQPSQSRPSQQPNAQQQSTGTSSSSRAQKSVARKSKSVLQGLGLAYVCVTVVACLFTALANLWFAFSCLIGLASLLFWQKFAKKFPVARRWVIGALVVCAGFLIVDLTHSSRRSKESSSVLPTANLSSSSSQKASVHSALTASSDATPKDARFSVGNAATGPGPATGIFNVDPMRGYGKVKPFMGTQCSWNNVSTADKKSGLKNGFMPAHTFMISPRNETCYVLSQDVPAFLAMGAVRGEPALKAGKVVGYVRGTAESGDGFPSGHLRPMRHGSNKSNPEIVSTSPSVQKITAVNQEKRVLLPQPEQSLLTTSDKPSRQVASGSKQADLSPLNSDERQSIESACSTAKYLQGPAAYNLCLSRHLQEWGSGPKRPDLSSLNSDERQSIESACSTAKYLQGPAAYNRCLLRQLQSLYN
jgi:hypothetical protein